MISADPIDQLNAFLTSSAITPIDIVVAVIVVIIGWIVSIFVQKGAVALLHRWQGITDDLAALAGRVAKYFIIVLSIALAFSFLGAPIEPLLAAAIIVGIVLVLTLRGIADNFAAGVVLQTRRPIKVGDEIESGDYVGTVADLNGRSVVIHTRDGRTVHVPNSMLLQSPVVNHSEGGARRSEIEVRALLVDTDTDRLSELVRASIQSVGAVHKRESVHPLTTSLGPDRVTYTAQFWHHPTHGPAVRSSVVEAIGLAAREAGLTVTVRSADSAPPVTPSDQV